MAATVVDSGNCSGVDVDKFGEFDLTAVGGEKVRAPMSAVGTETTHSPVSTRASYLWPQGPMVHAISGGAWRGAPSC